VAEEDLIPSGVIVAVLAAAAEALGIESEVEVASEGIEVAEVASEGIEEAAVVVGADGEVVEVCLYIGARK
jgi:hypothetical protein